MGRETLIRPAPFPQPQGELFALRWRDVDWSARRIRVRRNFVRGEFGTPKSKRSSRSVPLASCVATDLELLSQDSQYKKDDDHRRGSAKRLNPLKRLMPAGAIPVLLQLCLMVWVPLPRRG